MLLKKGSRGNLVKELQYGLRMMCIKTGSFDGIFGEEIYNGVKRFQDRFGLDDDGIVGNGTWNKLKQQIKPIQIALTKHNYSISTNGVPDLDTYKAVRHYQRNKGLKDDGMVGSKTRELLFKDTSSHDIGRVFPFVNLVGLFQHFPVRFYEWDYSSKSISSCDSRVTITAKLSFRSTIGNNSTTIDFTNKGFSGATIYSGDFSADLSKKIKKAKLHSALDSIGVKICDLQNGTLRAKFHKISNPYYFTIEFEFCTSVNGVTVYQILEVCYNNFKTPNTPNYSGEEKFEKYVVGVVCLGAVVGLCFVAPYVAGTLAGTLAPYASKLIN